MSSSARDGGGAGRLVTAGGDGAKGGPSILACPTAWPAAGHQKAGLGSRADTAAGISCDGLLGTESSAGDGAGAPALPGEAPRS